MSPASVLALALVVNGQTIATDAATDFQRVSCEQIESGQRLHIAGSMKLGSFVAASVRMQGPKPGDDEGDTEDGADVPPTTGTTPATGTTPSTTL